MKMHAMGAQRRPGRFVLAVLVLAALGPVLASAQAEAVSAPRGLRASGQVTGRLANGKGVVVRISAHDRHGWQAVSDMDVELLLDGYVLDQITLDPPHLSISVAGGSPQAVGLGGAARGPFLEVNAKAVGLSARGDELRVVLPITLVASPPADARLYYAVSDTSLNSVGPSPLGTPAPPGGSFSWGTLIAAVLVALFAGAFVGGLFTSKRRAPPRYSIYSSVQRGIDLGREGATGPSADGG